MALTFDYKVRDKSGDLVEGQLDGDSMALVVRRLREMGYMPISVTPKSAVNLKTEIKIPGLSGRIKLREIAVMTRQLSTMVDSGLSVVRSLGILAAQVENPELARILTEVRLDLEHGSSLSAACAKHPKAFSKLYCTLIQAGEVGGNLDEVLTVAGRHHREAGAAQQDDQVGHDLPGRGAGGHGRDLLGDDHLHRPGVPEPLQEPGRQAPAARPRSSSTSRTS